MDCQGYCQVKKLVVVIITPKTASGKVNAAGLSKRYGAARWNKHIAMMVERPQRIVSVLFILVKVF